MKLSRTTRFATLFAGLFLAFSMIAVDHADARRGGSFGSRGTRTFQSAPPTRTAPQPTAPVERSMTPNTGQATNPAATSAARPGATAPQRPGFMGGFGGAMIGGLLMGGLLGMMMGQGFGGLAGMFGMLMQLLLIGGAIWLALRFFRSRQATGPAMAGAGAGGNFNYRDAAPANETGRANGGSRSFSIPSIGGSRADATPQQPASKDITVSGEDLDTFQRLLAEVQEAFGREDHKALRRLVTPEMVSYLSEELADNAQNGVRNDVTNVQLLQADIAESWNEGDRDYATAAMNYSSIDVTRNRTTGEVVDGDENEPTETTELWTFVRHNGGDWQLSAIQEA
ncbi:Tim44 domain-containing protein [Aminobacter sp. NyZ550]|uniref:Tim44 domain-containing protein n=1 Tax=Aminobacter sp. NyZ550 TaxID=2979870 RepID=UPI0021D5BFEE|nr:Tim44 domain-containing protein [Aminobacter sp. NyZ550]WAX97277.1 Tim44 domain-containing protein [Aminobacter sp. NyZ550]